MTCRPCFPTNLSDCARRNCSPRRPHLPNRFCQNKSPQTNGVCGLPIVMNCRLQRQGYTSPRRLLDFIARQVLVRLGKFCQLRLVVDIRIGQFKNASPVGNVRLNIYDTVNFVQIASHGGSASPSEHVGNFKLHKSHTRLRRRFRADTTGLGCRLTTNPSCDQAGHG